MNSLIHFAGPIVDSFALVDALNNGVIAGAGLDVTDPEPLPRNHPLLQCANATINRNRIKLICKIDTKDERIQGIGIGIMHAMPVRAYHN